MNLRPISDFKRNGELYDMDKMVVYLNNILPEYNYSLKDLEKALGTSNDLLGGRIRRSKDYEKKGKLITRVQDVQGTPTELLPVNEPTINPKDFNTPTNDFICRDEFISLQNEIDGLRDIVEGLQLVPTKINPNMDIVEREEKSTSKTFRIYPSSLNALEQFCKLFPQYSKQDIISHIIDNFINNYKIK